MSYKLNEVARQFFSEAAVKETIEGILAEMPDAKIGKATSRQLLVFPSTLWGWMRIDGRECEVPRALNYLRNGRRTQREGEYKRSWDEIVANGNAYIPEGTLFYVDGALAKATVPQEEEEDGWAAVFKRKYCEFCQDVLSQDGNDVDNVLSMHRSCAEQQLRQQQWRVQEAFRTNLVVVQKAAPQLELQADVGPWSADDALYEVTG